MPHGRRASSPLLTPSHPRQARGQQPTPPFLPPLAHASSLAALADRLASPWPPLLPPPWLPSWRGASSWAWRRKPLAAASRVNRAGECCLPACCVCTRRRRRPAFSIARKTGWPARPTGAADGAQRHVVGLGAVEAGNTIVFANLWGVGGWAPSARWSLLGPPFNIPVAGGVYVP